jgi:ABC-type microcin C transport system duplicated ATPase subunit YejF
VAGHVKAVDGITIQVREGETIGVVGEIPDPARRRWGLPCCG